MNQGKFKGTPGLVKVNYLRCCIEAGSVICQTQNPNFIIVGN